MIWMSITALGFANIVNGQLEPDFPATVGLGAELGQYTFSACTGTLITPRIILSAAHCGGDLPPDLIVQAGKAFFGPSVYEADAVVGFTDIVVHPNYDELESGWGGSLGSNDFSLLVLAEDAPVQPVLYWTEPLDETWIGTPIKSVGFGITGGGQDDSGTKRSADLVISDLQEQFVIADNVDNPDNANICSGDSGGSQLYFNEEWGEWVQIAVHSWGDENCTMTSGSTRTDLVHDWILETVVSVHGTTDFCDINGYYDDDECTTISVCQEVDPACLVEEEGPKMGCSSTSQQPWWVLLFGTVFLWRRKKVG